MDPVQRERTIAGVAKTLLVIAIIGALNWGLIGVFNWNLVDAIFGGGSVEQTSAVSRVIYVLVGIAGLAGIFLLPRLHATPMTTPHTRTV
jgi:hypothetical protein